MRWVRESGERTAFPRSRERVRVAAGRVRGVGRQADFLVRCRVLPSSLKLADRREMKAENEAGYTDLDGKLTRAVDLAAGLLCLPLIVLVGALAEEKKTEPVTSGTPK